MALENCATIMRNPSRGRLLFFPSILCCVLFAAACPAQSFLFVSPNTRDHLSDEDATDSLKSFEQMNFLAVEKYLAEKLCSHPQVTTAEGIYAGNAENSSLVTGCSNGQAQYLGELLGRYAHQKSILVFDPAAKKSDEHLFILEFSPAHPADAIQELRQHNLSGATVIFQDPAVRVYVWTTDHSQDAALHALVDAEHATVIEIKGKGSLIGSDDRMAAQGVFDDRIRVYERSHHLSFSRLLWTKQLHDMATPHASKVPR